MAFGRISGPLLKSNLTRDGVDLAFENDLVYLRVTDSDPNNHKVGIKNDNPLYTLDVNGTIHAANLVVDASTAFDGVTLNNGSVIATNDIYAAAVYDSGNRVATISGGFTQFSTTTDALTEGTTNKYYTDARARAALSASGSISYNSTTGAFTYTQGNTDTVSEGTTNLYFTTARVRTSLSASGSISYNSTTGAFSYTQGNTDTVSEGTTNLYFTTARVRTSLSASGSISYNTATGAFTYTQGNTDTVSEGSTNLYFTNVRARAALSASGSISYNSTTGAFTYTQGNTDTVGEGTSNLYFTQSRARSSISAGTGISYNNSTGVIASTITQYTDVMAVSATASAIATAKNEAISTAATDATSKANTAESNAKTYADTKVAALVSGSPAALDTLNELAAALGNDANFSTSIATTIGTKLATADFASTFDTRLATKSTTDLAEGSNQYFTTARARAVLSASGSISYNSTTGAFTYTQGNTDTVSEGTTNKYYTDARARAAISSTSSALVYDSVTGEFSLSFSGGGGSLGSMASQNSTSVSITGGSINGTTIGSTTPAAGAFTSLSATNTITGNISGNAATVTDGVYTTGSYSNPAWITSLAYSKLSGTPDITALARDALSASGSISYDSDTGAFTYTQGNTDTVSEGTTNLYFTAARARTALSASGSISYDSGTGAFTYTQGNTDTVSEGTTNKYYTDARARAALSASGSIGYDSGTGAFTYTQGNTDTVSEGTTNKYYTDTRARAAVSAGTGISYSSSTGVIATTITQYTDAMAVSANISAIATAKSEAISTAAADATTKADLAETNAKSYADTKVAQLVDGSPAVLDTLNELAAALGDDANFSTTIAEAIGSKLPSVEFPSAFDMRLALKSTSDLAEGTNQYFTSARARSALSASGSISYNSTTGAFTYTQGNTDTVSEGTANQYFTTARARSAVSSASTGLVYNESTGEFSLSFTGSVGGALGSMAGQSNTNVSITGGSIDGTIIGATTAAAGTFTSVTVGESLIQSSSIDTGTVNAGTVNATYLDASNEFTFGTASGGAIQASSIGDITPGTGAFTTLSATSTITGDISGNAATVTNGVYTTGSYSDPSWITSLSYNKLTDTPVFNTDLLLSGAYEVSLSSSDGSLHIPGKVSVGDAGGTYALQQTWPSQPGDYARGDIKTHSSANNIIIATLSSAWSQTALDGFASLSTNATGLIVSTEGSGGRSATSITNVSYNSGLGVYEITFNQSINSGLTDWNVDGFDFTNPNTSKTWQFVDTGGIIFPDSSVQTTAWPGVVDYNDLTNLPTIPTQYTDTLARDSISLDYNTVKPPYVAGTDYGFSGFTISNDNNWLTVNDYSWPNAAGKTELLSLQPGRKIRVYMPVLDSQVGIGYSVVTILGNWDFDGTDHVVRIITSVPVQAFYAYTVSVLPPDAALPLTYNNITGVFTVTVPTSDTIPEGNTNLYFTNARALAALPDQSSYAYGYLSNDGAGNLTWATFPTLFDGNYDHLVNKPTIPSIGSFEFSNNVLTIPGANAFTSPIFQGDWVGSTPPDFYGSAAYWGSMTSNELRIIIQTASGIPNAAWQALEMTGAGSQITITDGTRSATVTIDSNGWLQAGVHGSGIDYYWLCHTVETNSHQFTWFNGITEFAIGAGTLLSSHWTFANSLTFPDTSVQSTAWLGTYSYDDLTNKPSIYSSAYIGTTNLDFTRSSGSQTLTGVSIDGNAATVSNGVYTTDTGTVTNTMLAGSIANSKLANSTITINGTSVALGGSTTVSITNQPLSTSLAFLLNNVYSTYDGSVAKTLDINPAIVANLQDYQTLTNKTMKYMWVCDASDPTKKFSFNLTNLYHDNPISLIVPPTGGTLITSTIDGFVNLPSASVPNSALVNHSITINGTVVALGGSISTVTTNSPLGVGQGLQFASGTSYDGTATRTISINSDVATLTGSQTLTNKTINGSSNTLTNIPNNSLVYSTITINGTAVALGGSITVTGGGSGSTTIEPLTVGTGLVLDVGTSFDGTASRTIGISSSVVTTSGSQTLTNKTISGASNTLSNIPNSALSNSSININGTAVSLGGSITGIATSAALAASYITINGSNITLGNGISGLAATANDLSQFATTTSTQLASIISGKTGTGSLVFASVSGTPSSGQALVWNGSTWTPGNVSANISSYSIDALSDVDTTTTSPTIGQTLVWNGTYWVPGDASVAGGASTARLLDTITPDGSASTFELRYSGELVTPASSAALIVSIDGVYQVPESAYNVLGSIITFAAALDIGSVVSIVEQGSSGSGSSTLSGLTDVNLSTLTDGQALVWNATSGKWVNGTGGFFEGTATIATAGTVAADTFSASAYSTAKYLIQATAGYDIHSTELTVIHNGTTAHSVEYGSIFTLELFTVAADLVAGNVLVNITTNTDNTTIDFKRVSIVSRMSPPPTSFDPEGDLMSGSGILDLEIGTGTYDLMEGDTGTGDFISGSDTEDMSTGADQLDLESGSGTYDLMGTTVEDMTYSTGTEDLVTGTGQLDLLV